MLVIMTLYLILTSLPLVHLIIGNIMNGNVNRVEWNENENRNSSILFGKMILVHPLLLRNEMRKIPIFLILFPFPSLSSASAYLFYTLPSLLGILQKGGGDLMVIVGGLEWWRWGRILWVREESFSFVGIGHV
ncbi:hypothetical protein Ancab_015822 [Ancistrocladus abbreviatus]